MAVSSRTDYFDINTKTKVVIFELLTDVFDGRSLVKHCCEFGQDQILDKLLSKFGIQMFVNMLEEMYELAIKSECFQTVQTIHRYFNIHHELNESMMHFRTIALRYHNEEVQNLFSENDQVIEESDLVALSRRFGFHDKRIEDKLVRDLGRNEEYFHWDEIRHHIFDLSCLLSTNQGVIRLGHGNQRNCHW